MKTKITKAQLKEANITQSQLDTWADGVAELSVEKPIIWNDQRRVLEQQGLSGWEVEKQLVRKFLNKKGFWNELRETEIRESLPIHINLKTTLFGRDVLVTYNTESMDVFIDNQIWGNLK